MPSSAYVTQTLPLQVFNVKQNGATGNGTTDDTTAINNTIALAKAAGGGIVYLPPGTYKTTATILINGDSIILAGAGFGSIIKPASGALYDAVSTPIPGSAGLAGFTINYMGVQDLCIDGSNMTGTTAGQGNLIHTYGARYSRFMRLLLLSSPNWAILLDGDNTGPGNNFGYDNLIFQCKMDLNAANIFCTNCEANDIVENRLNYAKSATAAAQPTFGSPNTNAYHLNCDSGYMYIAGNVFGSGGTYTTPAILCSNSGPCRIIGNRFDQVRHQAATLNAGNHEFIGNALGSPGSANAGDPGIQLGSSHNRVIGNSFDTTAGAAHWTYAVQEAGGPFTQNIIADNLLITGSSGVISLNATSTALVHHNDGYNPVGQVTAPGFPATTVAVTNNTGSDVTAYIANSTSAITVIQLAGLGGSYVTTGLQIAANGWGTVRIPSGGSIKLTYAGGTPSWTWFGD